MARFSEAGLRVSRSHSSWHRLPGMLVCWAVIATRLRIACLALSTARQATELSQTYHEIGLRSNRLSRWPDSKKFCDGCLKYDENTDSYQLPTFPDGHGPIGVFGFLHRNKNAQSIMAKCDAVFDTFCDEIFESVLSSEDQRSTMKDWILQSPPSSHHISVAILQEHPSFLRDPEDLKQWKPLGESTIENLGFAYAEEHPKLLKEYPRLALDSLLWTADGALIAGFVDQSSEGSFEKLRHSSRKLAGGILGGVLTTRPKNLIHATVGRIVGLPPQASESQHEKLTEQAVRYNNFVLPEIVERIRNDQNDGIFMLKELSLARNTVWMLYEYVEYSAWRLVPNEEDCTDVETFEK